MFYRLLDVYTRNFSFPHRGLRYFLKVAGSLGIANKTYKKKLHHKFFMLLNPTEHIQQQLFWYGYYEKELSELLKKLIRPDDVFIDIGANIGYFSLLVAEYFRTASVVSFEPANKLYQKMRDNIALNNVENVTTVNAAIGEINEEKELFISGEDNLGMSSFQQPENFAGKKERVKVVPLDNWFKASGLSKVNVIKLDIEGSELAALKGMKEILQNFRPLIIIEINPSTLAMFNLKSSDIYAFLMQRGFVAFLILEKGCLKRLDHVENRQTINVLFAHHERAESLAPLIAAQ